LTASIHQLSFVFASEPVCPTAADDHESRKSSPSPGLEPAEWKAGDSEHPASPTTPIRPTEPARPPRPARPASVWIPVFVRHPHARRYLLRVLDERTVRVTLPRWGSKREASAFLDRERGWIERERQKIIDSVGRRVETRAPASTLDVRLPPADLLTRARIELPARVNQLAIKHGLAVSRTSVRNQRSRWGSCSRGGHICLNWRLVTMPDWVRDYVIIHELMHLKRMDHSPRFWKLVASACPEFERARRYLRDHYLR